MFCRGRFRVFWGSAAASFYIFGGVAFVSFSTGHRPGAQKARAWEQIKTQRAQKLRGLEVWRLGGRQEHSILVEIFPSFEMVAGRRGGGGRRRCIRLVSTRPDHDKWEPIRFRVNTAGRCISPRLGIVLVSAPAADPPSNKVSFQVKF